MPRLILILCCFCFWLIGCGEPPALPVPGLNKPLLLAQPTPLKLVDVTDNFAVRQAHAQSAEQLSSIADSLSAGICALDANNDGWQDLLVVGGGGVARHYGRHHWWATHQYIALLMNQEGNGLLDEGLSRGLSHKIQGMACVTADFDLNGWTDILIVGLDGVLLYQNQGQGMFTEVSADSQLDPSGFNVAASLVDFNADGLVDIYISRFIRFQRGARLFEAQTGFSRLLPQDLDASRFDGQANRLYLNQGNFRFALLAQEDTDSQARSLNAKWQDLDQDGWPDLIALNDYNSQVQVFKNLNGRSLQRVSGSLASLELTGARDLAVLYDENGGHDWLFSRGQGQPLTWLQRQEEASGFIAAPLDPADGHRNTLYAGHWGLVPLDWDLDGNMELFVAAGLETPDMDSPYVAQAQPNQLVRIVQNKLVFEVAEDPAVAPMSSRGAIRIDLDNDGKQEIVVANNNDEVRILTLAQPPVHHWLGIMPDAGVPVGSLIGVKGRTWQWLPWDYAQGIFSQSDRRLVFGLADRADGIEVKVISPDQQVSHFTNLQADRYYHLNQRDLRAARFDKDIQGPSIYRLFTQAPPQNWLAVAALAKVQEPQALRFLVQRWNELSAEQKLGLIHLLYDAEQGVGLIKQGLRDPNEQVRQASLQWMKHTELETAIAWLTPMLSGADDNQLCAVADVLAFFFSQEEAVIYRKGLAIKPLLLALDPARPEAFTCIAEALAESESKRTGTALSAWLGDEDKTIRLASARTLGLIRDSTAIRVLKARLTKEQDSAVASALLVALARLQYPDMASSIEGLVGANNSQISLPAKLEVLSQLYHQTDATAIAPAYKDSALRSLKDQSRDRLQEPGILSGWGKILLASRHKAISDWLFDALDGSHQLDPQLTALKLIMDRDRKALEVQLLRGGRMQLLRVAEVLKAYNGRFSNDFMQSLAYTIDGNADMTENYLASLPVSNGLQLIDALMAAGPVSEAWFNEALRQGLQPDRVTDPTPGACSAYLTWWYLKGEEALIRQYSLALRVLLNKCLSSGTNSLVTRNLLLEAALKDPQITSSLMPGYRNLLTDWDILRLAAADKETAYIRQQLALLLDSPDQAVKLQAQALLSSQSKVESK